MMKLNFEQFTGTTLTVTHHGTGPTCIRLPYLLTRIGKELHSTPYSHFLLSSDNFCFAQDKEVRTYDYYWLKMQLGPKGDDTVDPVLCERDGLTV